MSGLNISNTNGGNAINAGDPSDALPILGVTNTFIHNNIFANNTVAQAVINLHNCQGNLIVKNNNIGSSNKDGVNILNTAFSLVTSVVFANNELSNNSGTIFGISAPQGHMNALIQNNVCSNRGAQIVFTTLGATSASMCGTITGNQISNLTVDGLVIGSSGSSNVFANVSNNTITSAQPQKSLPRFASRFFRWAQRERAAQRDKDGPKIGKDFRGWALARYRLALQQARLIPLC